MRVSQDCCTMRLNDAISRMRAENRPQTVLCIYLEKGPGNLFERTLCFFLPGSLTSELTMPLQLTDFLSAQKGQCKPGRVILHRLAAAHAAALAPPQSGPKVHARAEGFGQTQPYQPYHKF